MLVSNPKYQSILEIENEYKGYCVCIIKYKGKPSKLLGGVVIGYSKSLPDLNTEIENNFDTDNFDGCVFKSYTGFSDIGLIQVVPHGY